MGTDVHRKILEILVCPVTKTALRYDAKNQELVSDRAKLAYPIRNGIPVMISEKARSIGDELPKRG